MEVGSQDNKKSEPALAGGIMITAGSAIGAGIFALPVVSAGMWFSWAIVSMFIAWFCMYHASLLIMETTLHFHPGASFGTIVRQTLGKWPNVLNAILIMFLLYILDYAFISGGGSIVSKVSGQLMGAELGHAPSAVLFSIVFAAVVTVGMRAVDRVIAVIFMGMVITFFMVAGELGFLVDVRQLLQHNTQQTGTSYWVFMFAALPYFLTSFGFYTIVPSLVKYYEGNANTVRKAMLYGSLLSLCFYLVWILVTMGSLDRVGFLAVIAKGGNVGVLVNHIIDTANSDTLIFSINIFANLALISSFLGVSIGLFDYFSDLLGFSDAPMDRLKCSLIVFVPPTVGGAFLPDGFVVAIGYAGLVLAIHGLILPALVALKARQLFPDAAFRVWGGSWLIASMILAGVFFVSIQIMNIMNLLPVYGNG